MVRVLITPHRYIGLNIEGRSGGSGGRTKEKEVEEEGSKANVEKHDEILQTLGVSVKEPMIILVAVGLLDSTGMDIPLSAFYHDGTLESVSSKDQLVFTIVHRVTKKEEFVFLDKFWSLFPLC
ncbi:unnamed protein product [Lupinus luteus]|uniref:Uncharacterized protein n=1 Tax=Lupinus luteus TaxID=3873 RepID=A0AAV1VWP0_LUPLU